MISLHLNTNVSHFFKKSMIARIIIEIQGKFNDINLNNTMEGKTSPLVLVVDDSNTNVVLLEAILNDKGYEIETALNAKEAFAIMEVKVPDLICSTF
ncbi:MAG: hypothetical protein MZV70_53180 [Desulfobacterales bacterium]|nr:hypothetical protein [Desulfobacterales bacterium]